MKTILLYHIYPINNWREITEYLFQKLPFNRVVVHVSIPENASVSKKEIEDFFSNFPVDCFLYTNNNGFGEVEALRKFVSQEDLDSFDILTYMHCKGVTKPENLFVREWTKMMHYFLIEKMNLCKKIFKAGYITYGINKSFPNQAHPGFKGCNFFYEGNFVSVNLKKADLKSSLVHLEEEYYGLEGFWGKLCSAKQAYSAFDSGVNHYLSAVQEKNYKNPFLKIKYNLVREYYTLKRHLHKRK